MSRQLNKTGIITGADIQASHVTQSIDAFTGAEEYDITLSGSLTVTGSIDVSGSVINNLTASYAMTASYILDAGVDTNFAYIYYVSPSGSDATGEIGNFLRPFETISGSVQQAILDATSGGYSTSNTLIHVNPGHYREQDLSYNGNFYFEAGAKLQSPNQLNSQKKTIFPVGPGDEMNIFGNGEFISTETTDNDQNSSIIEATGGKVYFECNKISIDYAIGVYAINDAEVIFRGKELSITTGSNSNSSGYIATLRGNSKSVISFDRILGDSSGFNFQYRSNFTGESTVNIGEYNVTRGYGFYMQQLRDNSRIILNIDNMIITGSAVKGIEILQGSGGTVIVDGNIKTYDKPFLSNMAAPNAGLKYIQMGTGEAYNSHFFESHRQSPTDEYTLDVWLETSGSEKSIIHNNGKLFLNRSLYNTFIDGDGIELNGGELEIDNYKIITEGAGFSINSPNANTGTVKINNILSSNVSASDDVIISGPGIYMSDQTGHITPNPIRAQQITTDIGIINDLTASYAITASHALNGGTGGSGPAFPFTGNAVITGSLITTNHITASGDINSNSTISAQYFVGDGSQLTNLPQGYSPITSHTSDFISDSTYAGHHNIVGGDLTITVETGSNLISGLEWNFFQSSSGDNFTFTPGNGVILISKNNHKKLASQGSAATLKYISGQTFHLVGDLTL